MALKEKSSSKRTVSKPRARASKRGIVAGSAMAGPVKEITKRDRLEARVSTAQKKLINRAAMLQGRTLSDFVISTLDKEARKIVHDFEALEFSLKEKEAFAAALDSPPAASEKLVRAFERLAYFDNE